MFWWQLIELSKIKQTDRDDFLSARKGKVMGSDFANAVPATEEFVKHIIDKWDHKDAKGGPYKYSANRTAGDKSYNAFITEKINHRGHREEPVVSNVEYANPTCMMARGNMYETIVRNLASQIYMCGIIDCGPVVNNRLPGSGASPDGILMETKKDKDGNLVKSSCRNFEAKTAVARKMQKKVPIKYHIQVEKTAFELGLSASVYTEAQFASMSEKTWLEETETYVPVRQGTDETAYAKYGIIISYQMEHIYPNSAVYTPKEFLQWRDRTLKNMTIDLNAEPPFVTYFKVLDLWTVEIQRKNDYDDVYMPLIKKEVTYINYLLNDSSGQAEFQEKYCKKREAPSPEASEVARPAKRQAKNGNLYLIDFSTYLQTDAKSEDPHIT